ncbi:hypothetical protein B0F90DRAFT_1810222 [Multifurca ochricompacta]|uniref:DUF1746 domain-containing protein n=1 Tax=Multifurca ochricompacta TaxID=376703 RepID=A0AAD4M618_9AGAM|nr:hypothetical protein B0F90DRAFT_1810222 [Multifurca ochricompacta]
MHIRYATQRQHIVDSLDTLLYQLHVLSFFLAPSIITLFARAAGQFQLSHPREFGPRRTLRFRFLLIAIFNSTGIWNHIFTRAQDGRSVVLDFVGMASTPSRTQLLLLDLLIITLSVIVTTIAYEAAYARAVTKAAIRATLDLTPSTSHTYTDPLVPAVNEGDTDLVLDLRATLLLGHIRQPPLPPPEDTPLPNGAAVVEGLRVLLQAQRALRVRQEARQIPSTGDDGDDDAQTRERDRRVPGGIDPPEDGG